MFRSVNFQEIRTFQYFKIFLTDFDRINHFKTISYKIYPKIFDFRGIKNIYIFNDLFVQKKKN